MPLKAEGDSIGAVPLAEGRGRVRTANRSERSQGRSLLRGQDMGTTQDHRNRIEQWLAVGGGWWLAVGSGWRLAVGGGWWQLAVGGWWSLGAVLRGCPEQKRRQKLGFLRTAVVGRASRHLTEGGGCVGGGGDPPLSASQGRGGTPAAAVRDRAAPHTPV